MRKEFRMRATVLFIWTLGMAALAAGIALLPSYFLASVKEKAASARLEAQSREAVPVADQRTMDIIRDVNAKIALVERGDENDFSVSEKLLTVIVRKMPDIKITRLSFEDDAADGKVLSVEGRAPSRERLLLFRRALEDDDSFKKVDLPISNFVRGSDIQFYVELTSS